MDLRKKAFQVLGRLPGQNPQTLTKPSREERWIEGYLHQIYDILAKGHQNRHKPPTLFLREVEAARYHIRGLCETSQSREKGVDPATVSNRLESYIASSRSSKPYVAHSTAEMLKEYVQLARVVQIDQDDLHMFREDLSVNERALVVFSGRLEHLIHLHPELRAFSEALEQEMMKDRAAPTRAAGSPFRSRRRSQSSQRGAGDQAGAGSLSESWQM